MPTKDDFTPDSPLPLFLSERADEPEQPGIVIALDRAVIWSRILKTSILVVTASAVAILWVEDPAALFANVTASLVDISVFRPGTFQSTPTMQATAIAPDLPPTAKDEPPSNAGANPESSPALDDKTALQSPTSGSQTATDAPPRNEIAAARETADQGQTELRQPSADADALYKQYQAWAAEQDPPAQVVQPAQDAPAQVVQDARPQVRHMKKHRQVSPAQNARAEIRSERHPQAKVRREQNARAQVPPVQDATAQDQSVQNAQPPSFLQGLGLRN